MAMLRILANAAFISGLVSGCSGNPINAAKDQKPTHSTEERLENTSLIKSCGLFVTNLKTKECLVASLIDLNEQRSVTAQVNSLKRDNNYRSCGLGNGWGGDDTSYFEGVRAKVFQDNPGLSSASLERVFIEDECGKRVNSLVKSKGIWTSSSKGGELNSKVLENANKPVEQSANKPASSEADALADEMDRMADEVRNLAN